MYPYSRTTRVVVGKGNRRPTDFFSRPAGILKEYLCIVCIVEVQYAYYPYSRVVQKSLDD